MSDKLTEVQFWEDYWANIKMPSVVDETHSFDRCLSKSLEKITSGIQGSIFEVGCAPGKWIGHLSVVNGLTPAGIEYSSRGIEATIENLRMLKIISGELLEGDFFSIEPRPIYDVVMSLGFIEHFDDPNSVVERHLQWLKSGGILILGIPNFTGCYKLIQSILDKSLLEKHNLNIMKKKYFEELSVHFDLKLNSFEYLGSFEPDLPIPVVRFGNGLQFLVKCVLYILRRLRKYRKFDRLNGRFISGYILASFKKG